MSILSREEAQALTQRILSLSHADECRVSLTSGLQANTRFADNGVTTSGDATNDAVLIRSSFGRRSGTASTNILTDEGLSRVVETSERIARLSPEDREWLPELGPQQYREVPAFFERTAGLDPSRETLRQSEFHSQRRDRRDPEKTVSDRDFLASANVTPGDDPIKGRRDSRLFQFQIQGPKFILGGEQILTLPL